MTRTNRPLLRAERATQASLNGARSIYIRSRAKRTPFAFAVAATLAASCLAPNPIGADEQKTSADDPLARYDALISDADRRHWAFQPLTDPSVPEVRETAWTRNPIDAFVLARLEERGWRPAPEVDPSAWLRRVYLDLVGIPPTPAEQDSFLLESNPDSRRGAVVDELLARPAYGQRWGRHWLDLVRYADTNGYERDGAKPAVWRYRDYVIGALNADKRFDRFIVEQIAGDELTDANSETIIATTFHRLGPWDDEPADPAQDRFDQLDDMVRTTSEAFLGLTIGCARCHNHKLEPITMHDYYRMVAVFDTLERPQNGRTELTRAAGSRTQIAAVAERDRRIAELENQKRQLRVAFRREYLEAGRSSLSADTVTAFLLAESDRNDAQIQLVDSHNDALRQEIDAALPEHLRRQLSDADDAIANLRAKTPDLPTAYVMHEPRPEPPVTNLLLRGSAARPGPKVSPGIATVIEPAQPVFESADEHTSRRRVSLARWIASPDNPLTARVIVNRVWQFHFGEGLVRTANDFGTQGAPPTHPELLDWLARWFIRHDWSLKQLHRLILSSSTYAMSKTSDDDRSVEDPENRLLWHFPYRRLEVEAIRDSMLAASGRLNHQMYGESTYPFVSPEALAGNSDPATIWKPFDEPSASRRTIYAFIKRGMIVPMLEVLDLCDTTRSSAGRQVSSVAPQALTLLNGEFVNRQARHLAARLFDEAGADPQAQIERAYRLTLCRPPDEVETTALIQFLDDEAARLDRERAEVAQTASDPDRDAARREALVQVCRVILNLNEFVYPD